jgi:hypothetical protein
MTPFQFGDARLNELTGLQRLTPDPDRAERVRMRCREQLGQWRKRQERADALMGLTRRVLAPALVGGLLILYIAALVSTAIRLQGILR